ncbi:MAG: urease accessory protein UreE [Pseudomonadota bacterium]
MRATSVTARAEQPDDYIVLDETARHRRRIRMVSEGGIAFLLDLPEAQLLPHGAGLVLEDGRVIEVRAAPEALYEVRGRDSEHLLQLAWQLGNRHLPAQIVDGHIRIRADQIIKDMVEGLGGTVIEINAPFQPEGGAYGKADAGEAHGHTHSHSHGHSHG